MGEFEGWTVDEQIEFTKTILRVFEKSSNALNVFAYSVNLNELAKEIPETRANPSAFAHALLLKCLLVEIGERIEHANDGNISGMEVRLIHDRSNHDGILQRAFDSQRSEPDFKYKSLFPILILKSWQDCLPLQPADLLAYENFKEAERRAKDKPKMRRTLEILLALDAFGGVAKGFDKDGILRLKNFMDEALKGQILEDANIKLQPAARQQP